MKILAIEKEIDPVPDKNVAPHLNREALRAWELHQEGIIRELYFMKDRDLAVLILECDTPDQARQALGTLPLVREGLIDFTIIPLRPYPGFARLFSSGSETD